MGIILWSDGQVCTRFADADSLGVSVEEANYSRWVNYWQRITGEDRLQLQSRRAVRKSNPKYLKELLRAQKGNYILEQGGEIVQDFDSIDTAADFLFETLVSTSSQPREALRENRTRQLSDSVLQAAGLVTRPGFVQNHAVPLTYGNIQKPLHFHYALMGQGIPLALLLRVNINKELSVTSTAGKFASVESQQVCPKNRCIALYDGGEDNGENSDTIDFLKYWSVPLDVSAHSAPDQISELLAA